jgi:hypothetical protein
MSVTDGPRHRQFAQIRQDISQLFLSRFTLSAEEISLLRDRKVTHDSVGRPLFDIMDKVRRIRRDCRTLFEFVGAEVLVPSVDANSKADTEVGDEGETGEGKDRDGQGVEGRDVSLAAQVAFSSPSRPIS